MKIICVGKNYELHVKEFDGVVPSEPVIFIKPDSALLLKNRPFYLPSFSNEIHHEVELVVRICKLGKSISKKFAHRYYEEIGIGIDFTARDIQRELKKKGLPWEKAKSFDGAAVLGKFLPKETFSDLRNLSFSLTKNDQTVQQGNSKDMLFSIDEIIEYVSSFMTLKIGDYIYSGTPEGVGSVAVGDNLKAYIEDELLLDFEVK